MTPPRRRPVGAGYLVFADVDETVIRCRSPLEFLDHYFAEHHGWAGRRYAAAVRADLNAAVAAGSSREQANRRYYAAWRGERLADVRRSGRDWYLRRSEDHGFFVGETVAALHRHRAASAELALVSGSFAALLHPLAEELGASHVLAAEPAIESGVLTGELVGPPMIGRASAGRYAPCSPAVPPSTRATATPTATTSPTCRCSRRSATPRLWAVRPNCWRCCPARTSSGSALECDGGVRSGSRHLVDAGEPVVAAAGSGCSTAQPTPGGPRRTCVVGPAAHHGIGELRAACPPPAGAAPDPRAARRSGCAGRGGRVEWRDRRCPLAQAGVEHAPSCCCAVTPPRTRAACAQARERGAASSAWRPGPL